ncbi:MAG: hypothetical protein ABIT58_09390 [Ferruginibacter sp.]
MKKIFFVIVIVMIAGIGNVSAQKNNSHDYKNAVGIKFYPAALTAKHFFNRTVSAEAITYIYDNASLRFTGLLEFNFPIANVEGLKWFAGPGVHVSFLRYKTQATTFVGIDAILGLDYKFKGVPINLSVDWQPSFEFGEEPTYNNTRYIKDGPGFTGSWAGIAVRYTF